ncbi:MAG TPA: hypothetical protein VNI83_02575 [Vicinamibacterales bacterium]|nr:hypothetical protein [Vicinamibacterales bacterium]
MTLVWVLAALVVWLLVWVGVLEWIERRSGADEARRPARLPRDPVIGRDQVSTRERHVRFDRLCGCIGPGPSEIWSRPETRARMKPPFEEFTARADCPSCGGTGFRGPAFAAAAADPRRI